MAERGGHVGPQDVRNALMAPDGSAQTHEPLQRAHGSKRNDESQAAECDEGRVHARPQPAMGQRVRRLGNGVVCGKPHDKYDKK